MFNTAAKTLSLIRPFHIALIVIVCLFTLPAFGQKTVRKANGPAWQSYHEITLGATAEQVREKLGLPKTEDAESLFYIVSDLETAQFLLDTEGKVKAISVIFDAEHLKSPTYSEVFGNSVVVEPREDGGIFKMMRYEDLGFWISYNRMAGEKAMVIVLIQKI
jgi:outer membrane protein assembly factor BamE (lipoprotein component of BamABCDE complex)